METQMSQSLSFRWFGWLDRRPRRHAFTLVEMLVVIGILMILIAMTTIALRTVAQRAKNDDTQTALNTLDAMLKGELDATGGGKQINEFLTKYNNSQPSPVSSLTQLTVPNPGIVNNPQSWAPALVTPTDTTSALYVTQTIIGILLRNPNNVTLFNNLPAQRKLEFITINNVKTALAHPLILDGYGNPIIFVPAGGLQNVFFGSGTFNPKTTYPTFQPNQAVPIYFWLSAGMDGDFRTGNDNVCSKTN